MVCFLVGSSIYVICCNNQTVFALDVYALCNILLKKVSLEFSSKMLTMLTASPKLFDISK